MPRIRRPRQIAVPYNGKIADITEVDTDKHTLDLAAALGETRKIIALIIRADRIAGTGFFRVFPNEDVTLIYADNVTNSTPFIVIKDNTQRLQYSQTVANDDFDLCCFGYVVEA